MYETRTSDEILEELQSVTATSETLIEGGFVMDVLESNAFEFSKMEMEIAEAYRNAFGHTVSDEYLDLKAGESGIYRRAGKKSTGEVIVTGKGTVRAGNFFATEDNIRFVATEDVQIIDSGTVKVEALLIGAAGNVPADTIKFMPLNIPGMRACNNPAAMIDGYDEESDDSLRERYLDKVRYPAASGNPRQYIQWATSIIGVGAVRVQRCWAGAGTVKVIVIDSNFDEANVNLLERVWNYIETERPVGAEVSVVSAEPVNINIAAKIRGSVDVDEFIAAVKAYFIRLTNQTLTTYEVNSVLDYVSLNQIGRLLLNAGADDYSDLTLNGETENVALGFDDIPRLGEVILT